MEAYKEYLCNRICLGNKTIEEVEKTICNNPEFTINRNEDGKIHSRYLKNHYEPAIKYESEEATYEHHYYLFDGDIKDCTHPFRVEYFNGQITAITYYSSERIRNGKPNYIGSYVSCYNTWTSNCAKKILDEYECKYVKETNDFENFTFIV